MVNASVRPPPALMCTPCHAGFDPWLTCQAHAHLLLRMPSAPALSALPHTHGPLLPSSMHMQARLHLRPAPSAPARTMMQRTQGSLLLSGLPMTVSLSACRPAARPTRNVARKSFCRSRVSNSSQLSVAFRLSCSAGRVTLAGHDCRLWCTGHGQQGARCIVGSVHPPLHAQALQTGVRKQDSARPSQHLAWKISQWCRGIVLHRCNMIQAFLP